MEGINNNLHNNNNTKIFMNGNTHKINLENGKNTTQQQQHNKKCLQNEMNLHDVCNDVVNDNNIEIDRVMNTFIGKKIFITGGSGFIGIVLIEKFLRCFPDIGEICVLMRSKKNKSPQQRTQDMLNDPFFDVLRSQRDDEYIYSKIRVINGDIMELGLGLNESDRNYIIDEVSIIYHCAATVRFDESLKKACLMNTRGTQLMLDLAKQCKKLQYFAHVSTAYCHADVTKILEEKPYPCSIDPSIVIKACEKFDADELNAFSKKILKCSANTYVFTKSLAEALVANTFNELPTVILRPSIVTPLLKDPIPGWSSNFNGPVGLLIGAGKGIIRTMHCHPNKYGDMIPADLVINGIILSTWNYLRTQPNNNNYNNSGNNKYSNINNNVPRVYHLTNLNTIREQWKDVVEFARQAIIRKLSLGIVLWFPGGSITGCYYYHRYCFIFYQLIPAIIVDSILYCFKIKPILCKVQRRVCSGYEVFQYFVNNEWIFKNDNIYEISKLLTNHEISKYETGNIKVDSYQYLENCTYCSRKYLLKQKDEDLKADRKVLRVMWWLDQICKKFIVGYLIYYIFNKIYSIIFEQ